MGFRITTWNVNGIRNPFSYQPWRDQRTFAAMFDILEADIVVFQETKIQQKDLRDDMVLVPGWDCHFSYSGVAIYTRQSVCCPIRAEEGITGVLCPPNSASSFSDLPEDRQIGGYPTAAQVSTVLAASNLTTETLDSEGRCVILEFPAFVLIGVYSPANRDETRDDFRVGFLNLLDARVRNLVAMGKRVFLTGDLNISKEELDTANAESAMRKSGMTAIEYFSTPARRLFNHLLEDGKVYGDRDEGRAVPVLLDICRSFHPGRKGMFTCWEQKTNARPGNFGARIDYLLCSLDMRDWCSASNIQEGLMGSDHCPVYATMKERVHIDGKDTHLLDVMNPPGMFENGKRLRENSVKDVLPLSGRMIPEFDRRQSIRDMFKRKPALPTDKSADMSVAQDPPAIATMPGGDRSSAGTSSAVELDSLSAITFEPLLSPPTNPASTPGIEIANTSKLKRASSDTSTKRSLKRGKSESTGSKPPAVPQGKGQQSLKGFFKPKAAGLSGQAGITTSGGVASEECTLQGIASNVLDSAKTAKEASQRPDALTSQNFRGDGQFDIIASLPPPHSPTRVLDSDQRRRGGDVHDPIESKESWSKLFTKPTAPRCEGHGEPCISLLTKKSGMNCGRSFWMCPRPLGPSGSKEKGTQWRCQTFIWCSDWSAKDV